MVKIQLIENHPVVFYGSFTGRAYRLKNLYDVVWVDPRDASNLAGLRGIQEVN